MKNLATNQLLGVFCISLLASCATRTPRESGKDFPVVCTSAIANDVGACQIVANAKCKGKKAQLRAILSSTFLPANNLYQNTALYRCLDD